MTWLCYEGVWERRDVLAVEDRGHGVVLRTTGGDMRLDASDPAEVAAVLVKLLANEAPRINLDALLAARG